MKLALVAFAFIVTYGLLVTVSHYKQKQVEPAFITFPNECTPLTFTDQGKLWYPNCYARMQKSL